MPEAIQPKRRYNVARVAVIMRAPELTAPQSGIRYGPPGTLNARGKSGCLLRKTITPIDTRKKANSVPIEVSSPKISIGSNPVCSGGGGKGQILPCALLEKHTYLCFFYYMVTFPTSQPRHTYQQKLHKLLP